MAKRKGLPASLRWQVFARDGFRCRYCGSQAGEPGVVLHADHVISVAEGGNNALDNLVASCQRCNGGKGARSLVAVPGSRDAVAFAEARTVTLQEQAEAIAENNRAQKALRQEIVNLICEAYEQDSIQTNKGDIERFMRLSLQHGSDLLADWVRQAALRGVEVKQCIRYVYGIIRNIRERTEAARRIQEQSNS
jgi:hypothetical protein